MMNNVSLILSHVFNCDKKEKNRMWFPWVQRVVCSNMWEQVEENELLRQYLVNVFTAKMCVIGSNFKIFTKYLIFKLQSWYLNTT